MKAYQLNLLIDAALKLANQDPDTEVEMHIGWEYESQIVSVFVNDSGILVLSDVDADKSVKI